MRRLHKLSLMLVIAGGLLIWPAGAAAKVVVSPTSLTFGGQAMGTTSAAQQVTLTKDCTGAEDTLCLTGPGLEGPTFNTSISVSGPFSQTNNCPAALTTVPDSSVSCTINVTFVPTATGAASGTLSTGAGGPTAALAGTGTPAQSAAGTGGTATKSCKKKAKKHSARAAKKKKCKKRK